MDVSYGTLPAENGWSDLSKTPYQVTVTSDDRNIETLVLTHPDADKAGTLRTTADQLCALADTLRRDADNL